MSTPVATPTPDLNLLRSGMQMADLVLLLAQASPQDCINLLRTLQQQHLPVPLPTFSFGAGGAVGGPIGLANRSEWAELLLQGITSAAAAGPACYGASVRVAPVAAKFGRVQLQNPANSGQLVLVRAVSTWSNLGTWGMLGNIAAGIAGGALGGNLVLDRASTGVAKVASDATLGVFPAAGVWFADINADPTASTGGYNLSGALRDFMFVLKPGVNLDVVDASANDAFRVNLTWAEVPLSYPP